MTTGMETIAVLNNKGGVGKTTVTTNLAAALALRGHRVLVIDSDPQGNSTTTLGAEKSGGFYDLVVRDLEWADVIRPCPADLYTAPDNSYNRTGHAGMLMVVPSDFQTRFVAQMENGFLALASRIAELREMGIFDYIIFDTSPNPNLIHEMVMVASKSLIIPTDCESYSALDGTPDTVAHARNIRKQASKAGEDVANIIGILPNRYRSSTQLHNTFVNHLRSQYGDLVWEPLPLVTAITEAQFNREFLFTTPNGKGLKITQRLWALVDDVEKAVIRGN